MIEILDCSSSDIIKLLDINGLDHKCSYCGVEITEENIGGFFSNPNRVSCDILFCLNEAIGE